MRKQSPYSKASYNKLQVNNGRKIQMHSKALVEHLGEGKTKKTLSVSSITKAQQPRLSISAGNLLKGEPSRAPTKIWFQFGISSAISKEIQLPQHSIQQKLSPENSLLNTSCSQDRCISSRNDTNKDPSKSEGGSTCGEEDIDVIEKPSIDKIVFAEQAWHAIMEALRYGQNLGPTCFRCWDLIASGALQQLSDLSSDISMKHCINDTQILEILSVAVIQFFARDSHMSDFVKKSLKSLATFCYTSCLNFLQLIYHNLKGVEAELVIRKTILLLLLNKRGTLLDEESLRNSFYSSVQNIKKELMNLLKFKSKSRLSKQEEILQEKLMHIAKLADQGNCSIETARIAISEAIKGLPLPVVKLETMVLQPVKTPFLPVLSETQKKYTLVLDLDETLVHYRDLRSGGKLLIRPGAREFLEEMSKYFEIVIYTAGMSEYANWALNILDRERKWIKHRLFRQHTMPIGPAFIKDLSKLGRDLGRTIIVDNLAENSILQAENGICIKTWLGDPTDQALPRLCPILRDLLSTPESNPPNRMF